MRLRSGSAPRLRAGLQGRWLVRSSLIRFSAADMRSPMYSPDLKIFFRKILPRREDFLPRIPFLRALEGHSAGVDKLSMRSDKNYLSNPPGQFIFV